MKKKNAKPCETPAKKVAKATIEEWAGDSQVTVEGETAPGKTMSVFDTLEDLDALCMVLSSGR